MPSAKSDPKGYIEAFYKRLRKGTTVSNFLEEFDRAIACVQDAGLVRKYRIAKKESGFDLKKLRDEISPVARFAKEHARPDDRISFRLDNSFPDCILCHQDGLRREIEVTVARGLARFYEMIELNERGETRGLIGLQDDASQADIDEAKKHQSEMYSTDEAITQMVRAVDARAKGKLQHVGHTLLIEVVPNMYGLPNVRWLCLPERLADNPDVRALRFSEVYVTSWSEEGALVLRIR